MRFKLRDKETGEILTEDHWIYLEAYADAYGNLLRVYEAEDSNGHLGHYVGVINDEYEIVDAE